MSTTPQLRKRVTSHTRRRSNAEPKPPTSAEALFAESAPSKENRLSRLPSTVSQLGIIHEVDEVRHEEVKETPGDGAAWWKSLRAYGGDMIGRFCGR
ncbi:hypothetical protein HYFRA_00005278 [Hymenoscyphus fraxineus]|uniref:Uncharacterized protein n=1 Tax=Hymenoscyphus fraxineus TaxID=746836 RepID=A0A9N9Q092_9HELO|nr:hypothetical protein HYFRA_00005278 [Hymenoscyphus fraxineus]